MSNKNTASSDTKDKAVSTVPFDPSKIKPLKAVTVPLLKQVDEKPIYVTFLSEIYQAKDNKGETTEGGDNAKAADKKPPMLARVKDLQAGVEKELIVNTVLQSELEEAYPDNGYKGKSFQIVRHTIEGRRYKTYDITEIEYDG